MDIENPPQGKHNAFRPPGRVLFPRPAGRALDGRPTPLHRGSRGKAGPMEETRASQIEGLREHFQKRGVRKVKLGGFDVDGVLRGKYVSLDKFWGVAQGGLGYCDVIFGWDSGDQLYDNATVTGWQSGYPDLHATVDLCTDRRIPWEEGTAAFLLDFDVPVSPRQLLQKVDAKARAMGFTVKCACEYEFFIFKETPESVRAKGYSNLTPLSPGMFGYSWLRASENAPLVHDLQD